jgi:hypothetical protein
LLFLFCYNRCISERVISTKTTSFHIIKSFQWFTLVNSLTVPLKYLKPLFIPKNETEAKRTNGEKSWHDTVRKRAKNGGAPEIRDISDDPLQIQEKCRHPWFGADRTGWWRMDNPIIPPAEGVSPLALPCLLGGEGFKGGVARHGELPERGKIADDYTAPGKFQSSGARPSRLVPSPAA